MKIQSIKIIPLFWKSEKETWNAEFGEEENIHTLLQVTGEDGLFGLGSVYTSAKLVAGALDLLQPLIIGASATDPAATTEKLHQATFWQGRGGAVTHAISGLDIALWDLFGKITKQPISRLLGGRHREKIKPYGSMLMLEPAPMKTRLQAGLERGFKAFKIGWGPFGRHSAKMDEAVVAAAREAVGPDVELMIDAGGSEAFWPHGYKWALSAARMLAQYDVTWFEEALRPDDLDGYIRLTENAPLPISAGEVMTRRQSFTEWIDKRAVDYIQPDTTKVGGISEQHRIGQHADDHSVMLIPHGWNTAVGLAADLQILAAAGNARWVEYMTPSPYIDRLLAVPPRLDEKGLMQIPDGPGLGVQWNMDEIARLSKGHALQLQKR